MTIYHYKLTLVIGLIMLATVFGVLSLFSHTIMPGLKRTDDRTFVRSFQAIDRQITNPTFMLQFFGPLIVLGLAAWYAQKHQLIEMKYVLAALVCYLLAVIITMAINVPLNDGLKRVTDVTSQHSLADARTQFNESKWVLFNNVRTVLTLGAVLLTGLAMWVSKIWR